MKNSLGNRLWKIITSPSRMMLTVGAVIIMISLVRQYTGISDITSPGAAGATIRFTIPILMAGLGGLWAERSGVINIGLEGMMILGTWFGAWFGFLYGPWVGIFAGAIGGALAGILHAVLTVRIGIDQAVSGLAINLLGMGTARFLSGVFFLGKGGDVNISPQVGAIGTFTVPGLSKFLTDIGSKHILVISDIAGVFAGFITKINWASVVMLLALPITAWVLWKTRFGLRMRFCGENPVAAESLGVNVYRTRYIALAVSGALAGLGGAYISVVSTGNYLEGQTAGRGYIGLAAVIFGNWTPAGVLAGSVLFGLTDALRVRQSTSVHALLLVVIALALAYGVSKLRKKDWKGFIIGLVIGGVVLAYYMINKVVPDEFVTFFPNLTTILVLAFLSQRLRPPAMAGAPYRKGEESS
jgi:general nucleoside transport system permease protein